MGERRSKRGYAEETDESGGARLPEFVNRREVAAVVLISLPFHVSCPFLILDMNNNIRCQQWPTGHLRVVAMVLPFIYLSFGTCYVLKLRTSNF